METLTLSDRQAWRDWLAATYQQHDLTWIALAKREDTRNKRILASLHLLEPGQKPGMK